MENVRGKHKAYVQNSADEYQVKEASKREKERFNQEIADIKAVMSMPEGRRFVWRLINDICHIDATSANHSGSITYMLEGERNIGRLVKADVCKAALKEWQEMERQYWKETWKETAEEKD